MIYVGLDLHKKTIQIAAVDYRGATLLNKKIRNTHASLEMEISRMPKGSKYVIESSSVWEDVYHYMRNELGLDVVLSDPYKTKLIAESKKKTDKVDALILADMLRGGYISECYVPEGRTADERKLVRYRRMMIKNRGREKNSIHGILLQASLDLDEAPFSSRWLAQVRKLGDYRIGGFLRSIECYNDLIRQADVRVAAMVKNSPEAMLLKSIPGIGNFSALVISSMVGDIERFNSPQNLISYAGLAPSVRNSANVVHHGRITKRGDTLMRWVLTECVLVHIRCAPRSYITKSYASASEKRGAPARPSGRGRQDAACRIPDARRRESIMTDITVRTAAAAYSASTAV